MARAGPLFRGLKQPPKKGKKILAISTCPIEYRIHTDQVDIKNRMKNLKSILAETVRVLGVIAFWSVALPTTVLLFPVAALCHETTILLARAKRGTAVFRTSPIGV